MIPNRERWHYLAVKKVLTLLRGITSKNNGDFYYLNCLHSFKLESHKKVCEIKDFCNIAMPSIDIKILEFNQYQKSDKTPFIIYADLECLIEKIDGCKNNLKIYPQQKQMNIYYQGFQCIQYRRIYIEVKAGFISRIYTEVKTV